MTINFRFVSSIRRFACLRTACVVVLVTCLATVAASDDVETLAFTETEIDRILLHGPWPSELPEDAGNELSGIAWAEQLGEALFFDKKLSGNGTLSCASCHQPVNGFADGLAVAHGVTQHVRNTQGLWNIGAQRWFGWDGGADSLWAATLRPLLSPVEMAGDIPSIADWLRQKPVAYQAFNEHRRYQSLPNQDEALVVFAAKCIAAYMRTLVSEPTAFDQFRQALADEDEEAQSIYSVSAKRGLKIFIGDANCHACHYGPHFSNGEFHDIGRPFFTGVGQVDPGRYSGIERLQEDRFSLTGLYNGTKDQNEIRKSTSVRKGQVNFGQWRTPSLRNLLLTAPYMHDGSVLTLDAVVKTYVHIDLQRLHAKGESILRPLSLSDSQIADLVSFLKSLSP